MIPQFVATPFFDPSTEELRYLPEGPRVLRNYHPGGNYLGWVAIQHGAGSTEGSLNVLDLESRTNITLPLKGRPGFFAEAAQRGVVLVGLDRQLAYFDLRTGRLLETVAHTDANPRTIVNDGVAVEGGVFFGTKDLEFKEPIAALYFFESAGASLHTVLKRQTCSNGKYLRRDSECATLVDIDTAPKRISVYTLEPQMKRVAESRLVKPPESLPAFPDGMRPAPEGGGLAEGDSVVVAFYNSADLSDGLAQQIRLSDGAVLCEWIVPNSPRVTCPEFVWLDGKVKLIFTTAVEGMPDAIRSHAAGAGLLYIADTPFERLPAAPPFVPMIGDSFLTPA